MRHDPASGAIVIMLRSLKMYGMAQAVTDLIEQGAPAFEAAIPFLSQLLKAELAEREVRSIAYHMKSARFPAYKDLSGFDFAASEINEATVRTLHRCEFMDTGCVCDGVCQTAEKRQSGRLSHCGGGFAPNHVVRGCEETRTQGRGSSIGLEPLAP